jgi:RNA polymerase sigma-70 factor (ECF subfamily)
VRDFAQRRVGTDLAQEVVAETFLVAWRRLDDIPGMAVPWLYRVALYEIANLRRRQLKAARLHDALRDCRHGTPGTGIDEEEELTELARTVAVAFANLKPRDQEILRLAAWDQLSSTEGAAVLQCSVPAYRMRLHRARIRLAVASGARDHQRPQPHIPPTPGPAVSRTFTRECRTLQGTELVL